jgi:hypothetical protein
MIYGQMYITSLLAVRGFTLRHCDPELMLMFGVEHLLRVLSKVVCRSATSFTLPSDLN